MSEHATRAGQAVSLRVKQGDGILKAVFWVDGDSIVFWPKGLLASDPDAQKRWGVPRPPNRWDRPTVGINSVVSIMQSNLPDTGEVVIEGIWLTEITEKDHEHLDAGERRPTSLEQRVADTLSFAKNPDAPRRWTFDDNTEAATWIYNEILTAQHNGKSLDSLAEAPFVAAPSVPAAGTTLSESEKKTGITLKNGRVFYPRPVPFVPGFTDLDWLMACYNARQPVALLGPPGTGKTMLVDAAFTSHGLITVNGTPDLREHHLTGQFVPTGTAGEFMWMDGDLTRAMELGVPFLLDEFMRVDPQVMTIFYSLMDGRGTLTTSNPARGEIVAKEGFMPFFASNPDVPGAAMDEPLASRFTAMPTILTDFDLAETTLGINKDIVTVARNMDIKRQNDEVQWSPQMRELVNFGKQEALFSSTYAISELLARCQRLSSTSDRVVLEELIARVTGKSSFAPLVVGKAA